MKTRIISGIVMGAVVAAVLAVGLLYCSTVITVFVALLAISAVYELLHNAVGIKSKIALMVAAVYAALAVVCSELSLTALLFCGVLYFLFAACVALKNNREFSLADTVSLCAMPPIIGFAFYCLASLILMKHGLYYLILLLNFSSVCDMGAYFTGVTCGKHKLCPNVSPKKTVEGSVGGIISSIIVTAVITLCFGKPMLLPMLLTVPLCITGMLGDLFASLIKRAVGIKDYGNLIPGHGGILDRVDSIIMIVPIMYFPALFGVI